MLDNTYATTDEQRNGKPVNIGGTEFILRPIDTSNREFMVFVARNRRGDRALEVIMLEDLPEILADIVVTGWNATENGEALDFTRENAIRIFTENPRLAGAIMEEAGELGTDEEEGKQEDAESLGKS